MQHRAGPCLVIVWHSRTGAARALAQALEEGARRHGPGVQVRRIAAREVEPDDLLWADGYLFACPENLGTMSGEMKEMFDRCYYPVLGQIAGRAYATVIAAGSDGTGAQAQIDRIVTGWRLRRVAEPMIVCVNAQTPEAIAAPKVIDAAAHATCRDLGEAFAAGLEMGVF